MPTDTSVKFFTSAMSGAPALTNAAGTVIAVLDACLVNGFGSVTLDSLVVSSNVATGTVSTGHGFAMTGATGPVIRIEGATPSGLNGDWRIQTVPNSTTLTFATSGIGNQTATGTITAKRAPAGFEKAFSGTNLAAYRALDVRGTRQYFRIDDTSAATSDSFEAIRRYATMTDVNTGTDGSPVLYFTKCGGNSSAAKAWRLYADWASFWLIADTWSAGHGQLFFGDLAQPSVPVDVGHGAIAGHVTVGGWTQSSIADLTTSAQMNLAVSYDGTTKNVAAYRRGHSLNGEVAGGGGAAYQSSIGLLVKAIEAFEGTTAYRGLMPGWYGQVHANLSAWNNDYYEHAQIGTLRGDVLIHGAGAYYQFFDITGPWR